MVYGPTAVLNVTYKNNSETVTRKISFNGNYNFNIDDGKKGTEIFEGNYEVRDGQIYKDGKVVTDLELPTTIAKQLIGMSNAEIINGNGNAKDDTFTQGDFNYIEKAYDTNPYTTGKVGGWFPSDGINNRLRIMCGSGDRNTLGIDGYYNTNNGGYMTEAGQGSVKSSVSIFMHK